MYLPHTYEAALLLMVATMLCWGSWANTMKLCPGYRFQLFYWDYVVGLFAGILLLGITIGSSGNAGLPFFQDVAAASRASIVYAALGGVVFNIANLLLVAAIEIAGLAVAFPVGIGLALVVGAVSNYILAPQGIHCCFSAVSSSLSSPFCAMRSLIANVKLAVKEATPAAS